MSKGAWNGGRGESAWQRLERRIIACRACPRLVVHRERVSREKKRQFRNDAYWGRPVPGFGDRSARLLIVGLAPAAHGANRTGRMFTGDGTDGAGSSDFLAGALHRAGLANHPFSRHRGDGFRLKGAYLTAVARCAPPENRLLPAEIARCAPFLAREMALLAPVRVVVALGKVAFDGVLATLAASGATLPRPRPPFSHGVRVDLGPAFPLVIGSYHPSRQNTQTGRLTRAMLLRIFRQARRRPRRKEKIERVGAACRTVRQPLDFAIGRIPASAVKIDRAKGGPFS